MASSVKKPSSSSTFLRGHALQNSVTIFSASVAIAISPRAQARLFVVEIKAVFVLVIAEQLGVAPPVHHGDELALGLFARQQHREMFEHDLLAQRLVLGAVQQTDEVAEKAVFLQLLAQHQLALVDLGVQKLFAERLEHGVSGGS